METTCRDLAPLVARHAKTFGRETPLKGLVLTYLDAPSELMRKVYSPSFCAVIQGAKVTMLGETPYRYGAGQGLLASVDVPVTARIVDATPDEPYLAISLAVDPAMVTELLAEQSAALAVEPDFAALKTTRLTPDLCDPLRRLLELLDTPRDIPVLAPLIRREIVWRLLASPLGGMLRQIGLSDSHAARIGRATAWIRDHYAEPLRVPALAGLAHMSVPTFHRHFKAVTTLTPVQFQKQIRLQEARQLLLASHEVAAAGYAVGYESPSQFSRDYRRLFGAPPGRDGAAIRASLSVETVV